MSNVEPIAPTPKADKRPYYLMVIAGVLILPLGPLLILLAAVTGEGYGTLAACLSFAGALAASAVFFQLLALALPRKSSRGPGAVTVLNCVVMGCLGLLLVKSGESLYLFTALGFEAIAYLDYASRWQGVMRGRKGSVSTLRTEGP